MRAGYDRFLRRPPIPDLPIFDKTIARLPERPRRMSTVLTAAFMVVLTVFGGLLLLVSAA